MSEICNTCTPANNLPACVNSVVIGRVTALLDYYIYVQDTTVNGYPKRFTSTADVDGDLVWTLGNFEAMPNHSYKIWATLTGARNNQCFEPIAPADCDYAYLDETFDCFSVHFEYIEDEDLMRVYYDELTLTLA